MHVGAVEAGDRALVVDDLIATGGTLCAAINLLGKFLQFYEKAIGVINFKPNQIDINSLLFVNVFDRVREGWGGSCGMCMCDRVTRITGLLS